ncbi:phosphoglycerate mutase-like protein [Pisolithus albus]|nr:phosphoglycerate mutase-like protein [Pisolithus albus]
MEHDEDLEATVAEREGLLTSHKQRPSDARVTTVQNSSRGPRFTLTHLLSSFASGVTLCFIAQLVMQRLKCPPPDMSGAIEKEDQANVLAPPFVGSTQVHNFPPPSPTNYYPDLFPTDVGYPGSTPTGAEPALILTAPSQPVQTGAAQLVLPPSLHEDFFEHKAGNVTRGSKERDFNLFRSWGNLSPWYSVPKGSFGIDEGPEPPQGCSVVGVHLLHRHGARYPTGSSSGPATLSSQLHESAAEWEATGSLAFLNDWTYKLGEEVLTPFGRQQLFDLGVSMRLKYGFLLENFTAANSVPVFRTESQDRMHASAINFALGFFGWPLDGKYEQVVMIEAGGFNNSLAPYDTCPNANAHGKADRSSSYVKEWMSLYLKDAKARLQAELLPSVKANGEPGSGFTLTDRHIYSMQQMCAYETVALGYSKFCELFTEEEWEGFNYSMDLLFWYDSAFGSPVARIQGLGYIQELVSRLTHTPIEVHNSSTNSTWHREETWPLYDVLYVDATHEVVMLNILTALNLTTFAETGPLPADHIPANRSFRASDLAPFTTNVQFQLLRCPEDIHFSNRDNSSSDPSHIRIVINDGPVPLHGIQPCPVSPHGLCPLAAFLEGQKQTIRDTDWTWGCFGNWTIPAGPEWETVGGQYPPKPPPERI